MSDLTDPRWIKAKGLMFLFLGLLAGGELLALHPEWLTALLLVICIWAFCRFYYFAFYVLEKYVDPAYRYAGLWAMFEYLLGKRKKKPSAADEKNALHRNDSE